MPVYGVDVHDGYQAGLSFPVLYRQGYRFAAVKLTQGAGYVREAADDWIRTARAGGLIPGAYHWLTSADGGQQARWFYKHVVAAGGPAGWIIQLDCEDDGLGPQMMGWAAEWNRLTGRYPFLVYSADWWWPRTGGYRGAELTPYLWDAEYLTADADAVPDDPAAFAGRIPASWWTPGYGGWSTATILQFTSRGDAGDLANNVDLDVYPGDLFTFRRTLTRGEIMPDRIEELRDVVTALALGATEEGFLPTAGNNTGSHVSPTGRNINLVAVITMLKNVSDRLDAVAADLAEVKARPPAVFADADLVNLAEKITSLLGPSASAADIVAALREFVSTIRLSVP